MDSLRLRTDVIKSIRWQELNEIRPVVIEQEHHSTDQTYEDIESMPSCDDCGQVYKDMHYLQTHIKEWCSLLKQRRVDDDEIHVQKRIRLDDEGTKRT